MADYNLGTARGTIEIGYKGAGPKQAQADMEGVRKSSMSTDVALGKVARTAGISGLVLAGGLAVAANAASNFEARLSGIQAVSGATEKQMGRISDKALQLGKDTVFSAGESAQAIEELIKAGISVEDVLNGAADATVNLAAAGSIDMPTAAQISSNAMNQFGLTAKDMVGVVDSIAGAANASAIDVKDFGMSLGQVGAVANLAGLSFQDTAVAIAEMGNAGIKGSDAGTSLKAMFSRLQPSTKVAADELKRLGIITEDGTNKFYDQNGRLKNLADVQQVLQDSLKGMTQQQKQAALQTIFGSDAIRAAAVLSGEGAAGYKKMADAMGKVSAADVAAKRMDNLKGSIEQLKGSGETLAIQLGTILIPTLTEIVDKVTAAVNWFSNLSDGQQQAAVTAIAITAGLLLTISALIKIVQFAQAARAAFVALRLAMLATSAASSLTAGFAAIAAGLTGSATGATFFTKTLNLLGRGLRVAGVAVKAFTLALLTNPIFLIIAAIVALVAALVLLYKKNEAFRNFVNAAWASIKDAIATTVEWITGTAIPAFIAAFQAVQNAVATAINFIRNHWRLIISILLGPFGIIIALVTAYFNQILAVITGTLNAIKAVWNAVWNTFGPLIKAVFGLIVAIIQLHFAIIRAIVLTALYAIKAIWDAIWWGISAVVKAVWAGIVMAVQTYLTILRAVITSVLGVIRAVVTSAWNVIRSVTVSVWNAIKNAVSGPVNALRGIVAAAVGAVRSSVSAAWNAARSATISLWNGIKNAVSSAISALMHIVSGIRGKITGVFSGAGGWLLSAGKAIVQGLIDGITSMVSKATGAIKKVTSGIGKFVPGSPVREGPLKVLNKGRAGKKIVDMLAEGITDHSAALEKAMAAATNLPLEAHVTQPVTQSFQQAAAQVPTTDLSTAAQQQWEAAFANANKNKAVIPYEGKMSIDESGEVWVKGKAREVNVEETEFGGVLTRMDGGGGSNDY